MSSTIKNVPLFAINPEQYTITKVDQELMKETLEMCKRSNFSFNEKEKIAQVTIVVMKDDGTFRLPEDKELLKINCDSDFKTKVDDKIKQQITRSNSSIYQIISSLKASDEAEKTSIKEYVARIKKEEQIQDFSVNFYYELPDDIVKLLKSYVDKEFIKKLDKGKKYLKSKMVKGNT